MNHRGPRFNSSGYYDPVAYEAIGRGIRDERKKSQPPKIYICSPFKGDTVTNKAKALKYCRFALEQGKFPIAPHAYLPQFMDDDNPAERVLALSFGIRLLGGCKEIWVFGNYISEGMKQEIRTAEKFGIKIKHFNENMEELNYVN